MGRRSDGALEDIFRIALALPWWAGVALAIVVFVLLHAVAEMAVVAPTAPGAMGDLAARSVYVSLAKIGQWVVPAALLLGAAGSAIQQKKRAGLHAQVASAGQAAIDGMSWRDFELVVGEAFRRRGFSVVETDGGGADGGVDLVLANGREKYLVQCKHWRASSVGVTVVRELYGVMAAKGASGGFVVTAGHFSAEARAFADGRHIELIDGPKLTAMIRNVPRNDVSSATAGQSPQTMQPPVANGANGMTCPRCGSPMVKRIAKKGNNAGKAFWGCSAFPRCREIRPE